MGNQIRGALALIRSSADRLRTGSKPHILIACMPKSGSTFLSEAIASLPGFHRVDLVPGYERREQELAVEQIRRHARKAYVAQHHVRFSRPTAKLIARYRLTPVVLVRDLFDCVVSLRDHIRNESVAFPTAFFDQQHRALPDRELERAIVHLAIPWYVNFYMSWRTCADALMVRYDELIAQPAGMLCAILRATGQPIEPGIAEDAVARARRGHTRLNVGVVGRGRELAGDTRQAVLDLLAFYPDAADDAFIRDMLRA